MRRFEDAVSAGAVDLEHTEVVLVDDGSSDGTAAEADKLPGPAPPSPGHPVPRQPGQGRGRPGRHGRGPLALRRLHGRRHGHRPPGRPPPARRTRGRTTSPSAAGPCPIRWSRPPTPSGPCSGRVFNRLVTAGHRPAPEGHPVRLQGLPHAGGPPALPSGAHRPVRLRRRDPGPCPSTRAHGQPRSPSTGSTSTAAPSTRSTTHWSCSTDVYRSRRGRLAGPPVPTVTVRPARAGATVDPGSGLDALRSGPGPRTRRCSACPSSPPATV